MEGARFRPRELATYVEQVLQRFGVPLEHARTTADSLVAANLRGVDSHGVRLLPIYADRLERGIIEPRPRLQVVAEGPAFAAIDGDNGLGPVVGAYAMDKAIALARSAGVAATTARRSNHFGAGAWYAARALAQGLIGLATSNGSPALAPWGGRAPFFGANPIAFAIPAGVEPPVIVDMATSVSARARIRRFAARGETIPPGWAIDPQGTVTTDAAAALAGALLPIGGPKGSGLALVFEVLAGALSGAGFSHEHRDLYADLSGPQGIGHFFLVINPDAFLRDGSFSARVDALVRALRNVPPAQGVDRVRAPGELDAIRRSQRYREGIVLPTDQVAELAELGERLDVPFPSAIA